MPQKKRMPTAKKTPSRKRVLKKTASQEAPVGKAGETLLVVAALPNAPEECIIASIPKQPLIIEQHHIHLKQAVFLSIGFMVLFTSFLFVSTKIKAQNAASVSAVVAPNPFNTRPPKQPSWWDSLDPYTKLYGGSGIVGAAAVGYAAFLLLQKKSGRAGSGFAGKKTV